MFDVETLLKLELFNQVIPVWQVIFFFAALVPFLLLKRVRICLFLIYLYTFYLGFIVQWGDYLANAGALFPFMLYAFSGIVFSFVIMVFKDEGFQININWRRTPVALREFDPRADSR